MKMSLENITLFSFVLLINITGSVLFYNWRGRKMASVLNVNVNPTDIEISDKLKRRGNNSSLIIVKFLSHKVKTSLYKKRVKLRIMLK